MTPPDRSPFKPGALALGLLAFASPAFAQTAAPANPCDVSVQSRTAGTMQVGIASASPGAAPATQLAWRPVASGPKVMLWVSYPGSALTRMAEPNGVLILFQPGEQATPEAVSVQVRTANGRSWRFAGSAIKFGKDQAEIQFGQEFPYGRGVLGAIADAQSLTIAVQANDQTLAQESFSLSNIDSRDTLLAQARAKFQAAGCKAG